MGMEVRSLRSSELGNAAHVLIERDAGVAVVVDALRDVGQYLAVAARASAEVAWALETHVHNDFVSGARELVAATGARLGASSDAGLRYPYERLGDGDELEVGAWRLQVLATPGHTPEHVAYLLLGPSGEPEALFSGGALMVGTAARTDLFGPALSWRFAHDLERSLREKILELPDHVVVYPTHGGGSYCAAGAGATLTTTIGAERAANPLVAARSSRQFVTRALVAGPFPAYYARMRSLNQAGAPLLGLEPPLPAGLGLDTLDTWLAQDALVVDVRSSTLFRAGHIPDSIAAGADGNLSGWVGWLVGLERPLVLVADPDPAGRGQVVEAARQLARIGYDRVVGFLAGGIDAWRTAGRPLTAYETVSAAGLAERLDADELLPVVDVREPAEWHAGHVPGSVNLPAHDIGRLATELPRGVPLAVHCGHDYRATLGASLLERAGYGPLVVVGDGWDGWAALDDDPT
ncbi:MAG: rhodanese-like domain-containing protein [Acidimicrobiales bacterium]